MKKLLASTLATAAVIAPVALHPGTAFAETAVTPKPPTQFDCKALQVVAPEQDGVIYSLQYADSPTDAEKTAGVTSAIAVKAYSAAGHSLAEGAQDTFRYDFSGSSAALCANADKDGKVALKPLAPVTRTPQAPAEDESKIANIVKPSEFSCWTYSYIVPKDAKGAVYSYMTLDKPDKSKEKGVSKVGVVTAKVAPGWQAAAGEKDSVTWRFDIGASVATACEKPDKNNNVSLDKLKTSEEKSPLEKVVAQLQNLILIFSTISTVLGFLTKLLAHFGIILP